MAERRQSGAYGVGRFIGGLISNKKKYIPQGMSENPERDGGYAVAVKPPSRFANALSGGQMGQRAYLDNLEALERLQKEDMSREMFERKMRAETELEADKFEREKEMLKLRSQYELQNAIAQKEAEADMENEAIGMAARFTGKGSEIPTPLNNKYAGRVWKAMYGKSNEYGTESADEISKTVNDRMKAERWSNALFQQTEPVKRALEMEDSRLKNDEAVRRSRFPVSLGNNVFGQNDGSMMFAVPPRVEVNDEPFTKETKNAEGKVIMSMQDVLRKQKQTDPYFKPVSLPSGSAMSPVTEEEIQAIRRRQNPTNWQQYLRR